MKNKIKSAFTLMVSTFILWGINAPSAFAKSEIQLHSIDELLASEAFQSRLGDFKFSFGNEILGQPVGIANVKRATNGIGKTDQEACEWAMISALLVLKQEAQTRNGIAVEAIQSTVTGTDYISATHYQCRTGHTNSRVLLKGTITALND